MSKIELARQWCLDHIGCPYVYGGTGKTCTVSYREARAAQYPSYAAKIRANCPRLNINATTCKGCKWANKDGVGRPCYDCAQLVRWCMESVGIIMVSGANSQWTLTDWEQKGTIDTLPQDKLCIVYREDSDKRKHHTGIYLGDGTIVHAKGHDYGVIREQLGVPKFTHWGVPKNLYTEVVPVAPKWPALGQGNSGAYVIALQALLVVHGLNIGGGGTLNSGVDGKFGAKTANAVREFQAMHGLNITGNCGAATWNALLCKDEKPAEQVDDNTVAVNKSILTNLLSALENNAAAVKQLL